MGINNKAQAKTLILEQLYQCPCTVEELTRYLQQQQVRNAAKVTQAVTAQMVHNGEARYNEHKQLELIQ